MTNPITPSAAAYANGTVIDASYINNLAAALNRVVGYATTVTAAGTTTLAVGDNRLQRFTGTTTQTVTLPVVTTLGLGMQYIIQNKSTGVVTVQSSGANTVYAVPAGATAIFTCIAVTGTTAASWEYDWSGATTAPSAGATSVFSQQTVTGSPSATISFPSIPATSKNIRIEWNCLATAGTNANLLMRFNADTAANYDAQNVSGVGTGSGNAESYAATSMFIGLVGQTYGGSGQILVPNYPSAVLNKNAVGTFFAKWGTTTGSMKTGVWGGQWRNTAAVTQIDLTMDSGASFGVGSVLTMYLEN